MIDNIIIVCTVALSFTILMAGLRLQNVLKHEDPDKMRSGLFLQYDVFKQNTIVIVNGILVILLVQLTGIVFSIQQTYQVHRPMMLIVSLVSLFIVGYILFHLSNAVSFAKPNSTSNVGAWRAWLE